MHAPPPLHGVDVALVRDYVVVSLSEEPPPPAPEPWEEDTSDPGLDLGE